MSGRVWRRRNVGIALVVALAITILAGCAPQSQEPGSGTSGGGGGTGATSEKLVRIGFANVPLVDPAVGSDEASSAALANLYDTLVFPNDDGSVRAHVAEDWDISDDGLVYTFRLKQGIKFHDGSELTAEDVVYTLERIMAIGEGYGYLFTNNVASAQALDTYEVEITLQKPFGPFLSSLVRLYIVNKDLVEANTKPDGAYGDNGDYGRGYLLNNDAGSGPYQVKVLREGDYLLMERFADYWDGFDPNNPDELQFYGTLEPATTRTMLSRQELEVTDQYQPAEVYPALAEIPGVEIANLVGANTLYLMTHTQKPPTDDVHFRRALAHIINYEVITSSIVPDSVHSIGSVSQVLPGANPNAVKYEYDLAKAEEELKKSKYYGQLDQYPVDVAWIAETPDREKLALLIQAEAAKVGIQVNVVKVPWLSFIDQAAQLETTPHTGVVAVGAHYAEAGSILESRFHSRSAGTWEQTDWVQDPQLDAMIDDAIATQDYDERMSKYAEIIRVASEQALGIPLIDTPEKHAYQAGYVTWEQAENAKAGKPVNPVLGYFYYGRGFKVYPEKK